MNNESPVATERQLAIAVEVLTFLSNFSTDPDTLKIVNRALTDINNGGTNETNIQHK